MLVDLYMSPSFQLGPRKGSGYVIYVRKFVKRRIMFYKSLKRLEVVSKDRRFAFENKKR